MVVDSLLKIVAAQGADALVLPPDAPPFLDKAGETKPLSMPALGEELLQMALEELTTPEHRTSLRENGSVLVPYAFEGMAFEVTIELVAGQPRLTFRREGSEISAKEEETRRQAPAETPASAPPAVVRPSVEPIVAGPTMTSFGLRRPVTPTGMLAQVLHRAQLEGASDILLSVGNVPRIRVGVELLSVGDATLSESELVGLLEPALDARARDDLSIGAVPTSPSRSPVDPRCAIA